MRIGIIRLSALGDCIVCAAFLAYFLKTLESHGQKIHITWFVDSRFAGILEHSPYIHSLELITLKHQSFRQLFSLTRHLAKIRAFDLLIDMQGLLKSALIGAFLKKNKFLGFSFLSAKESLSALFYSHSVRIAYQENILKRNALLILQAQKLLGIDSALLTSELHKMLSYRQEVFSYSKQASKQSTKAVDSLRLIFVLEASLESKTYHPLLFSELAILLDKRLKNTEIILLTHRHKHKAEQIFKTTKSQLQNITLTQITNLNLDVIKALVSSCDLLIGGDTGITHLAWALARPSITLYGNTPKKRFALLGEKTISLSANTKATYKKDDFSINTITPQTIASHVFVLLDML